MDTQETMYTERDKGFTLIELLIVIVILGILATVTVFAVGGITSSSQSAACDADLRTLEVAIESYRAQYGDDPATIEDLGEFWTSAPSGYEVTNGTVTVVADGVCDTGGGGDAEDGE